VYEKLNPTTDDSKEIWHFFWYSFVKKTTEGLNLCRSICVPQNSFRVYVPVASTRRVEASELQHLHVFRNRVPGCNYPSTRIPF